jgi:hypothetical protein
VSARYVVFDEIDRAEDNVGSEGAPGALAEARQTTFEHNRKTYYPSSPTIEGQSPIAALYAQGTQRVALAECIHCGHLQPLEFERLVRSDDGAAAYYPCCECGALHAESDATVRAKAAAVHRAGLVAIICIGESLAEREAGRTIEVLTRQLQGSLPATARACDTVVAYEPVWAIGTGKVAVPAQVAEAHAAIRAQLGHQVAEGGTIRLLYGGSVKPDNASELLRVADVDGALVGGASLDAGQFLAIAATAPSR